MDAIALIILAGTLLVSFGVLIGCTFSQWLLDARDRRQAAVQRALNEQWQELGTARQAIAQQRRSEPWEAVEHPATSQHGTGR
jgi:cell division protein FtsL